MNKKNRNLSGESSRNLSGESSRYLSGESSRSLSVCSRNLSVCISENVANVWHKMLLSKCDYIAMCGCSYMYNKVDSSDNNNL